MGFCPYFLHAQESDGGVLLSPLRRDPSTSLIGTDTTLFCIARLLFLGDETDVIFMSLKMEEEGDSAPFSGVLSFSCCSVVVKGRLLMKLRSMTKF